jgi:hypothetical protein
MSAGREKDVCIKSSRIYAEAFTQLKNAAFASGTLALQSASRFRVEETNEHQNANNSIFPTIDSRLTDDRSDATLQAIFGNINPVSRRLLQARFANEQFVIPTSNTAGGFYNGSAISLFDEQQFSADFDFRLSPKNWLSLKFFYSDAPEISDKLSQPAITHVWCS